jgi:hypothetical protein
MSFPLSLRRFPGIVPALAASLLMLASGAPSAPAQVAAPGRATAADTVTVGRFDNGKMWTFEYPPTEYLRQTYGFAPDTAWYRKARLGALRIPSCSASLVSARGLVMTNHHCGRDGATEVRRGSENILDNGFYARSERDERRAESMYADQLIEIVDVSARIDSAAAGVRDAAAAESARDQAGDAISGELSKKHGERNIEVEIVSLWNGAKTSAYVFRRHTDVRLVMTPELQIGYFGGDPDNFTYPRYALDYTFFRLYGEDGRPLATPDHFSWSPTGVKEGDLIFVIGNPGSTSRLQTVAELEFRRDVQDLALVHLLNDRVASYQQYVGEHPDAPEELRNELFGFLNAQKAYGGMLAGLQNPDIMARRAAEERAFRDSIGARPALTGKYGLLHDRMREIQGRKSGYASELKSFIALGNASLDPAVLQRALFASQYVSAVASGAPATALEGIKALIQGVGNQPPELQELLMAGRLRDIVWGFGPQSTTAQTLLGGQSPEVVAAAIQRSPLADSARTVAALAEGTLTAEDPAIKVGREVLARLRSFQSGMQQLSGEEDEIARDLGRARFDVFGLAVPPDATFSLRLADGLVKGYEYNGTIAPVYTTLYGMYDRYFSHAKPDWTLPQRWLDRRSALNLATPANFIATADIIGGNSGSPVVDRDLRIVGIIFDGNIESLPGDYIYMDQRSRAVAVDARGILETLRVVYRAGRLVRELTSGR